MDEMNAGDLAKAMQIELPNNSEIGWIHAGYRRAHFDLKLPNGQTFRVLIEEIDE